VSRRVHAVYRGGVFVPEVPCELPEETSVDVIVPAARIEPPTITDLEERRKILARVVERMSRNPLPEDAPRFTRDELHERR
jgi:predicted DNA-binding antitoxin AbrB/MazE fold protein